MYFSTDSAVSYSKETPDSSAAASTSSQDSSPSSAPSAEETVTSNVSANSDAAAIPTVSATSTPLSLTEQILQAKIQPAHDAPSSTSSSSSSSSSGSGSSSSKEDSSSGSGSQSESKAGSWFRRNGWKLGLGYVSVMGLAGGGFLVNDWGAPKRDDEGNEIKDEFSELPTMEQYLRRCYREMILFKEMIQEPTRPRLLPDPLTEPYFQPPYTLVLEMTGVLVHPDWTYRTGWRFKKRPQVEHFLQQVTTPLFEIVIFTSEHAMTAYGIIDNLDPNGYVMYRLFRDSTNYKNGVHHKDISHLNRDPKRVIVIDWDEKATSLQPENSLRGIDRWTGDDDDRTLMDLAAFLRALAYSGVDDVRTVLAHYNQHDNPLAVFKANQRRAAEEQEAQIKMQKEMQEKKTLAGGAFRDLWGRRR